MTPPIALTMGEPAGVGGELVLKVWSRHRSRVPPFLIIDDADRLDGIGRRLGLDVPLIRIDGPDATTAAFASGLPVMHRPLPAAAAPGRPDPANAPAVTGAIETAVALAMAGSVRAVVTNPIHKKALMDAGFAYPGHTEFLAALAGGTPVMMLACPGLRVVPITVHMGLRQAIADLTTDEIIDKASICDTALRRDFAVARPRLAVAGLNPHAGEGGALGSEEERIIAPAVAALNARGIDAFGPEPPDTLFASQTRNRYDAAICMYHDQALIPLKTLDMARGVNITLGLPIVRTSPDHGTAFDIAGTGSADESSLVAALTLADEMARRRAAAAPASIPS